MSVTLLSVGNPNSGKTTFFNSLTGSNQQVGNWPGVTVEKKVGCYHHGNQKVEVIDLPGLYAMESEKNSVDEMIASHAIWQHDADMIINVVDATCLERSLYLTLQLRELNRPMVVVLNKMDALRKSGRDIDHAVLSRALGCPVFALSAFNPDDVVRFKAQLDGLLQQKVSLTEIQIDYDSELTAVLDGIVQTASRPSKHNHMGVALRLLEGDPQAWQYIPSECHTEITTQLAHHNIDVELFIAQAKYQWIYQTCLDCVNIYRLDTVSWTEKIDRLILNRFLGIPLFLVVMYLMFMVSINIGSAFIDFFDIAVGAILVDGSKALLTPYLPDWLVTLLAEGIGGGVQTVATFIPVVTCLYLCLSVIESSGYMARAAFVLDKMMQGLGLPGKAFVPLVLGFGCNVPSVMATRTLERERERRLTAAMVPFMSCGARLPVYALFAASFFPQQGQNVVFGLYLLGIGAALFTGWFLSKTVLAGQSHHSMIELPRYEWPRMKHVMVKTWHKLKRFILGAGKVIVLVVAVLNVLNSVSLDGTLDNQTNAQSVLAKASQWVTPAFEPMGIESDNWPATVGIITGVFAKEAVVGTLNTLYVQNSSPDPHWSLSEQLQTAWRSIGDNLTSLSFFDPLGLEVGDLNTLSVAADEQGVDIGLYSTLQSHFAKGWSAFGYLVFVLLYTPCAAALGAYQREFGRGFTVFVALWTFALAYSAATVCFQVSQLSSSPLTAGLWLMFMIFLWTGVFFWLRFGRRVKRVLQGYQEVIL